MNTKLYPDYKQAAYDIDAGGKIFYSDVELAQMLSVEIGTDEFRFAIMNLNKYLLDEYNIDFIRAKNETKGKGYKIATDQERVDITTERLSRRFKFAVAKQRKVLNTVDRSALPDDTKIKYDRYAVKNGLLISFLNKTPLSKCLPGAAVRVDVPKMIEG